MKKTNNKGFSLVELIIVIAIMAILAGAIAPALIRYIDKSRKSNDVTAAKAIKTAVETALGNESIYEYLTTGQAATAGSYCYVYVKPGMATSTTAAPAAGTNTAAAACISVTGGATTEINGKQPAALLALTQNEIATNLGEKTPKLKFRKTATASVGAPKCFVAVISGKGTVYVFISSIDTGFTCTASTSVGVTSTKGYQICPNLCDEYQ